MEHTEQDMRILIVEDDPEVGIGLEDYFTLEGYHVARATDGEQGLTRLKEKPFDVVLLDVMLPGKNGFDVLREARQAGVASPVIMLTVKGEEVEKLHGFELGADDYVTKPFQAEELLARVRAGAATQSGSFGRADGDLQRGRRASQFQQPYRPSERQELYRVYRARI